MASERKKDNQRRSREFVARLRSIGADGKPRYSEEQIRELVPLLFMATGKGEAWSRDIDETMRSFCLTIGVTRETTPDEFKKLTTRYYTEDPGRQRLIGDLKEFLREALAESADPELAASFLRMMGDTPGLVKAPPEAPKDGQTRAGPMARFALGNTDISSKKG